MRTYSRNVRRAWDGEDYRPAKRLRLDDTWNAPFTAAPSNENTLHPLDLEDSLERAIRETSVAALSSSPSRKNSTIFSAESHEDELGSSTITPPSSPPPELQLTPPNVKARKPTFSFLDKSKKDKKDLKNAKRKRDEQSSGPSGPASTRYDSEPLSEILNSSTRVQISQPLNNDALPQQDPDRTPVARPTIQVPRPGSAAKQRLVQTVLDLGQPLLPTTCSQCQMSYTPSLPEDTQLHNMYHNRDNSGIELGKAFLKSAMRWCYQVPQIPGSVIVVDRKMALPSRKVVQKVLGIVNKELGSVDIQEDELWSQRVPDGEKTTNLGAKSATDTRLSCTSLTKNAWESASRSGSARHIGCSLARLPQVRLYHLMVSSGSTDLLHLRSPRQTRRSTPISRRNRKFQLQSPVPLPVRLHRASAFPRRRTQQW